MTTLIINEHTSAKYPPRTYYNAKMGDVTLALAVDLTTAGELLTHRAAGDKYIGFKLTDEIDVLDIARPLYRKLKSSNAQTLNIAGNGIYTLSKYKCDQKFINQFVYLILEKVHTYYPIKKIYTGGQTGVDIAGAVAAVTLGIEAEVTLPKGYLQRFEDNKDVVQTKDDIHNQINNWVNKIELVKKDNPILPVISNETKKLKV